MRIVLDSNILVSALISGDGYPGRVLAAVKREGITLVTSEFQIEELRDLLTRERLQPYIRAEEANDLLYHLKAVGMVMADMPEVNVSPDPRDNPILATAVAGEADLVVSGDKGGMLALGNVDGILIVTARAAIGRLRRRTAGQAASVRDGSRTWFRIRPANVGAPGHQTPHSTMHIVHELDETRIAQLHEFFAREWWTSDRSLGETRRCVEGSQICIGLTDDIGDLIGFVRVITDYTFKALVFDVIVADAHRGKGLGDHLIKLVLEHPELARVRHFELYCLPDVGPFYERHGFSTEVGGVRLMRRDGA